MDFNFKLPGRRKPENFVIYPPSRTNDPNRVLIQSNKSIAEVLIAEKTARIFKGQGEHPGFVRLAFCEMEPAPDGLIEAIEKARPKAGTEVVLGGLLHVQY